MPFLSTCKIMDLLLILKMLFPDKRLVNRKSPKQMVGDLAAGTRKLHVPMLGISAQRQ